MAASDDDVLLHRLKKLSAQLDSAKQSAEQTVKEVARAQETSEKVRKAVAPLHRYRRNGEELLVRTSEPTRVLNELTGEALARGEELERLEVRRPTLEEVYLALVSEEDSA